MTMIRRLTIVWCAVAVALAWGSLLPAFAQSQKAAPFNRYYLERPPDAQVHFYSMDQKAPVGWRFEGVEGYVSRDAHAYTVPLYRYYFDRFFDHVYTTSTGETPNAWGIIYRFEGIAGHVVPKERDIPGTVPLYRFTRMHPANDGDRYYQDHFYSLNAQVPADYIAEGACCRVFDAAVSLPDALLKVAEPKPGAPWAAGVPHPIRWMVWTGGGYIRLSSSRTAPASWTPIAVVPAPTVLGVLSAGTFTWTPPGDMVGNIALKVEWVGATDGTKLPWAEDTVTVKVERKTVPPILLKKK
jgi:hypothetical protein